MGVKRDAERRGALTDALGIGDAVQVDAGHVLETDQESASKVLLVHLDPGERAVQAGRAVEARPQRRQVVDRRNEAGDRLVALRAQLEPVARRCLVGGTHPVCRPRRQKLPTGPRDAQVRAEELVRRAQQHIDAQFPDVDPAVRGKVDRVGPRQRPGVVRQVGDPPDGGHGAHRVRRERERHDPRARRERCLERSQIDRQVGIGDRHGPHEQAVVVGDPKPRTDVGVMVEHRRDDLVAWLQRARDRVGEHEVERRHVWSERDLLRGTANQVRRRAPRTNHQIL